MGLFGLFKKKSDETKVGNVEDFISLTRVYFQSVIATNLGITNIRFLPDVANFKRLFKVPTQNGKLGLAEKYEVSMPIVEKVNQVLFEGKPAKDAVSELMMRDGRSEYSNLPWD